MDESSLFTVNTSNNGINSMSYDIIVKRLIEILRNKTSDSVKQLEDLWDSVNSNRNPESNSLTGNNNTCASNNVNNKSNVSNNLKRDSSKINNSNSSNNELNKKIKLSTSSTTSIISTSKTLTATTVTSLKSVSSKTKLNDINSTTNNNNTINSSSGSSSSKVVKLNQNNSELLLTSGSAGSSSSSSSSSNEALKSDDSNQLINDLEDFNNVVDMLDFSCSICKQFNQELNNKLIECRKCTKLFHQLCHKPKIEKDKIESNGQIEDNDSRQMAWYFDRCMDCAQSNECCTISATPVSNSTKLVVPIDSSSPENTRSSPTNSTDSSPNSQLLNSNLLFKKEKTTNMPIERPNTLMDNSHLVTSTTLVNNPMTSKTQVKGLAALANKLNSPSPTTTNGSMNGSIKTLNSSINGTSKVSHDDLFKKFRQTATSNTTTSNSPNSNSSNQIKLNSSDNLTSLDLKKKFQNISDSTKSSGLTTSSSSTANTISTTSNANNSLNKKPLFNLNSAALKTNNNLIVNSVKK